MNAVDRQQNLNQRYGTNATTNQDARVQNENPNKNAPTGAPLQPLNRQQPSRPGLAPEKLDGYEN